MFFQFRENNFFHNFRPFFNGLNRKVWNVIKCDLESVFGVDVLIFKLRASLLSWDPLFPCSRWLNCPVWHYFSIGAMMRQKNVKLQQIALKSKSQIWWLGKGGKLFVKEGHFILRIKCVNTLVFYEVASQTNIEYAPSSQAHAWSVRPHIGRIDVISLAWQMIWKVWLINLSLVGIKSPRFQTHATPVHMLTRGFVWHVRIRLVGAHLSYERWRVPWSYTPLKLSQHYTPTHVNSRSLCYPPIW